MRESGGASAMSASESEPLPLDLVVYLVSIGGIDLALLTYRIQPGDRSDDLTDAEHDVLRSILAGKSNSEIAVERGTSLRTVANQAARIFRKMGVRSRTELTARWALGAHSK